MNLALGVALSLERQRDKNRYRRTRSKTQRSDGWQGASVGAVSAKVLLGFVLARKRRFDLATVRAVPNGAHPSTAWWKKTRSNRCAVFNQEPLVRGYARGRLLNAMLEQKLHLTLLPVGKARWISPESLPGSIEEAANGIGIV